MPNRKLTRLTGFDYSLSRYYFITICVKGHIHSFGAVENGAIRLSENGIIAQKQLIWLKDQFPYIELISYIVMPDHVHGIIHINTDFYHENVGNGRDRSLHSNQHNPMIQAIPKIKPLPELVGAYKTTVSKNIHLHGDAMFKWQKSFHDHIIRNNRELNSIINYIETNPSK
jgi:putative transposase